jgi:hypothetical protein
VAEVSPRPVILPGYAFRSNRGRRHLTFRAVLPIRSPVDVSAVTGALPAASAPRPTGVAAQLAEARSMLRAAVPADRWDAVHAEVQRLQNERGIPMLAALHAVSARIAAGWMPPA